MAVNVAKSDVIMCCIVDIIIIIIIVYCAKRQHRTLKYAWSCYLWNVCTTDLLWAIASSVAFIFAFIFAVISCCRGQQSSPLYLVSSVLAVSANHDGSVVTSVFIHCVSKKSSDRLALIKLSSSFKGFKWLLNTNQSCLVETLFHWNSSGVHSRSSYDICWIKK